MTIDIKTFVAKAPVIEAVLVTEDNIYELATWMGAGSYSVEKTIVGGKLEVTFFRHVINTGPDGVVVRRPHKSVMAKVNVGQYLIKHPKNITDRLQEMDESFWSADASDIEVFVNQGFYDGSTDVLEVFHPPYDR